MSVVKDVRRQIDARLRELKPLVDEYHELQAMVSRLHSGEDGGTRRKTRSRSASSGTRRGRRRGSGTRATQAFELVKTRPGITVPELAAEMGIKQNYLYRVMPALVEDGNVRREGKGWYPAEAKTSSDA